MADLRCKVCGFLRHSHGEYSAICPVLVRGMLTQFQAESYREMVERIAKEEELSAPPPALEREQAHPADVLAEFIEGILENS